MAKYDAFGREIGEDTLAGLGGSDYAPAREAADDGRTDAQLADAAAVAPEPVEPAPFVAPTEPAPAMFQVPAPVAPVVRVRRRRGLGCLVGLIVLAAIAAGPIIAVVGIVDSVEDTFDSTRDAIEGLPGAVPEIEMPAEPPTGIAGRSMVARPNFGRALARFDGMGRVTLIRLSPDRVDAQLVKGPRQRSTQVDFEGELTRGPATPGGAALSTIALSEIDRAAPARLVRAAAARYRVRPRGINYLVLMPWPGEGHRWVAYFKNGIYVQGDSDGRVVRRIS